jgi:hypothetical protein
MRSCRLTLAILTCIACAAPALEGQDVITKTNRSGPRAGGAGTNYSEWYLLKSDPAPPGYALTDAQFKLEGSASCNLTAQCLEGERTQTQSIWLFRIQGQTAHPGAPSEAVLTTKYTRTGTETTYVLSARTPERFSSRGEAFGCFDVASERLVPEGDGPWCSLSATPPRPGYRIESASFTLQGDRECTGNDFDREVREPGAQCRLTSRTESRVTWQFRMLGHDEGTGPTAQKSFGALRVIYEKLP